MTNDDKEQFLSCLMGAADITGKELSIQGTELYWEILKQYDIEDVTRAFTRHASNPDVGQFMPKPADIIKAIDGGAQSRSMRAWTKVEKALRLVGPYQSVIFDDPIIHKVLHDMGGWILFGQITDHELPFKSQEFNKRYASYLQQDNLVYPRKLTGISESSNESEGHKSQDAIMIGDKDKASKVYLSGGDSTLKITKVGDYIELLKLDNK